jgi:hypothetical protein
MEQIMSMYGKELGMEEPKRKKANHYIDVSNKIQEDFDSFKKFYNTFVNGVVPCSREMDYSEDWNEKNLDGSFAYNGVTDDF